MGRSSLPLACFSLSTMSRCHRRFLLLKSSLSAEVTRVRKSLLRHAELLPAAALQEQHSRVHACCGTAAALLAAAHSDAIAFTMRAARPFFAASFCTCLSDFHFHSVHSPLRIRAAPPSSSRAAFGVYVGRTHRCCRPFGTAALLETQQVILITTMVVSMIPVTHQR
jgi:hypothetical protein